jgi:N-acetylglucosamine kinase-like BadF-type ATPase
MSSPPTADHIVVAADVGQSGTRLAIADGKGIRVVAGRSLPYGAELSAAVSELVADALAAIPDRPARFDAFCAGITGLNGRPPCAEELLGHLQELAGVTEVVVSDDSVTSYLGALGLTPGAVVAAGTGAVVLATDGEGRHAHVDGAGHLIGDSGSGYWIGRAALESAWRAGDGRRGSAALREAATAHFGELRELPEKLALRTDRAAAIAGFATVVASVASAGDEIACGIWSAAAEELAASTEAALERVGLIGHGTEVSVVGALTGAGELLLDPFRSALARRCPEATYVEPRGTALDGALLLASVPNGIFGHLVASAHR